MPPPGPLSARWFGGAMLRVQAIWPEVVVAVSCAAASRVKTRPPATIGAAMSRARRELPAPMSTVQIGCGSLEKARWVKRPFAAPLR